MTKRQHKAKAMRFCKFYNFNSVQNQIFQMVKEDISYALIGAHPKVQLKEKQVGKQVELMIKKVNKKLNPRQERVYSMFGVYKICEVYTF